MDEKLREMLAEGETLLWSGQPLPFDTLDATNRRGIIISTVVKAVVTAGILAGYCAAVAREGSGFQPGLVVLILLIAGFALYYPFRTARHLRRNTLYGLTDRRVLRVGSKDEGVPYDRIKSASLREDADGQFTLLCGRRAQKLRPGRWRNEADTPFINDSGAPEAQSVLLYALPMDDRLRGLLKQYLQI